MSSFNITNFMHVTQEGLAREAHFDLQIVIPEKVRQKVPGVKDENLNLLCTSAYLPTRSADVTMLRKYGTGLLHPYVTGTNYGSLETTFYCDANGDVIKFFQAWLDVYMNYKTVGNFHMVEYKDSYATTLILNQYSSDGKNKPGITGRIDNNQGPRVKYVFEKAFPVNFGPITFGWASRDNLVLVPASFVYTSYKVDENPADSVSNISTTNQPSKVTGLPATGDTNIRQNRNLLNNLTFLDRG